MAGKGSKPGERRGGRKKGTPNKLTKDVKTALLNAFSKAGGEDYLLTVAKTDPKTFCALLGKAMPMQVAGDPDSPLQLHSRIEFAIVGNTKG
jgi:hypothetical protein